MHLLGTLLKVAKIKFIVYSDSLAITDALHMSNIVHYDFLLYNDNHLLVSYMNCFVSIIDYVDGCMFVYCRYCGVQHVRMV